MYEKLSTLDYEELKYIKYFDCVPLRCEKEKKKKLFSFHSEVFDATQGWASSTGSAM